MKKVLSLLSALTLLFNTFSFVLVSPVKAEVDLEAPMTPTGLHIIQGGQDLGCDAYTNNRTITVDWDDNGEADLHHYDYQIREEVTVANPTVSEFSGDIRDEDGYFKYRVQAVDTAGNVSGWTNWCGITLDRVAPESPDDLGFNVPPGDYSEPRPGVEVACGGYTNQNQISHHWTDTSASGAVEYIRQWQYPGSGTWSGAEPWTTPYTNYRSFGGGSGTQGLWNVRVQAKDAAGNASEWSNGCSITYDVTPPVVEITSPTSSPLSGTVPIRGSVTDDNPHHYWLVIQDSSNNTVAGPGVVNDTTSFTDEHFFDWDTTGLNGIYTVKLEARDAADNKDATLSVDWHVVTVDNISPTADLVFPVPGPASTSFQVVFNEDVLEADAENPLNYFLNNWPGAGGSGDLAGDAVITYDSPSKTAIISFTNPDWYISPEQEWGVQNIHDLAGNLLNPNPTTETSTPMIPPIIPGIPETIPNPTNSISQDWTWLPATDDGGSGVKGYYSQVQVFGIIDPPVVWDWLGNTLGTTTNLGEGFWQLFLKAEDRAGNQSEIVSSNELLVDLTPPSVSWNSPSDGDVVSGMVPLVVTTSDALSGVDRVEFFYSPVGVVGWTPIAGDSWNTLGLVLGDYDLKAVVYDKAGNTDEGIIQVGVAAVISNVQGIGFDTDKAWVTWTTDRPTSSRVVYQLAPHPVFGGPPNYGYAFSTPTFHSVVKVTEHTVYISDLSVGTEYAFRVISEGSPVAISGGYSFQTLSNSGAPIAGGGPVLATAGVQGAATESTTGFNRYVPESIADEGGTDEPEDTEEVLGDEAEATPTPAPGDVEAESDGLFASSSIMRILRWLGILIGLLVLFYFFWGFFRRKNKKQ